MNLRTFLSAVLLSPALMIMAHDHQNGTAGLEFHENKGQWPSPVLFRAMTPGGAVFVEPSAFTHVLKSGGPQHARPKDESFAPFHAHAVRVHFEGGRAQSSEGVEQRNHYVNYFIGSDPAMWAGGVAVHGGVELHDVWPGIDLHVHGEGGLKYDWVVRPGADPAQIVLRYEGQDKLEVRDGLIRIGTTAGEMVEQPPVVWSEVSGERIPVRCHYVQDGERVRLAFPDGFDRSRTLVIDPTVIFSSYSGSFGDNFGFTATYDDDGHLYGGGLVREAGYPVTPGVIQSDFMGPAISGTDMGISKFSPDGSTLIWSTYVGGTQSEVPHSLVVNSDNELYILGSSGSADYPVTTGSHDVTFGGGPFISLNASYGFSHPTGVDIVVTHLSVDATALIGSTYVGGDGTDGVNFSIPLAYNYGDPFRGEIALDANELPVIASCTNTAAMPVTAGAPQAAFGGGTQDGFVFRMDVALTTMLFATYAGGTGDDATYGVQFAPTGEVVATGGTTSLDLPMAGTPLNGSAGGAVDGFIYRYAADGSSLLSSTYLGTNQYDQSYFVQTDLSGAVYAVGQTRGAYPVSAGVYANPSGSQFIHKLSGDLSTSLWSTRIGTTGQEDISPSAFLVSDCGQIYFSGWGGNTNNFGQPNFSSTLNLPVTADAFQSTTDGSDFYLMVLNTDAVSLAYATFFGGNAAEHVDGGTSRFDKDGIVYQAVCAGCGGLTFPTTTGVVSQTNNSNNCNLGVFKIDFEQNVQVNIDVNISGTGGCVTEPIVFNAVGTADTWAWDLGDGTLSNEATLAHIYDEPGTYIVMLIGTATGLCVAVDTAFLEVTVVAPLVMDPDFSAVPSGTCDAVSVEFFNTSTGTNTFFWQFGDGTTSTAVNPVHPYAAPGVYDVVLAVIDPVCMDTLYDIQSVLVGVPGFEVDIDGGNLCPDGPAVLSVPAGFDSYVWSTGDETASIEVIQAGEYSVLVTDGFCTGADTITVLPAENYAPFTDYALCPGQTAVLSPPFAPTTILWSTGSQANSITATVTGTYWYEAVDPNGCVITDTVDVSFVTLSTEEAIIPNVFSPNGDGINEIYLPENIDASDFSMDVYNRWGQKVFSSASSGKGWNGEKDNGGDDVPDGTYFVIITYIPYCSGDDAVTYSGHVTLLR